MKRIKEILKELKSKEYNILLDELEELFVEFEKNQLFKEDFEKIEYHERDYEGGFLLKRVDLRPDSPELVETIIKLKDNSKYDILPSKEDK